MNIFIFSNTVYLLNKQHKIADFHSQYKNSLTILNILLDDCLVYLNDKRKLMHFFGRIWIIYDLVEVLSAMYLPGDC